MIAKKFFTGFNNSMRINNIKNNIKFNGYKCIIANDSNIKGSPERLMYISMILNNEGTSDLDKYHEIIKLKSVSDNNTGDVLNLIYHRVNNARTFLIDDATLPFGDYLKFLRDKYLKGECSQEFFSKEESFALKTYTFLADLTKRIMNQNIPMYSSSQDKVRVMTSGIENLIKLSIEPEAARCFMFAAFYNCIPYQKIAGSLNRLIQKSMEHYL